MSNHLVALARRGYEAHQNGDFPPVINFSDIKDGDIPKWAIASVLLSVAFFALLSSAISYTYGQVIATLLMVDTPSATLYVPVPKNDDPDAPLENAEKVDQDLVMVKQVSPMRSSLFKAHKYLNARAGHLSGFRGLSCAMAINFVAMYVGGLFGYVIPSVLATTAIVSVMTSVAIAPLSMAWTHIVISEPSSKYWFQRIPSFQMWKKVVGPTFILTVAQEVATYIPFRLASAWGLENLASKNAAQNIDHVALKIVAVALLGLAASFLIVIPANVSLTRVQASLLPEEEETIIPFDRSFGGRVVPAITGGSTSLSLSLNAWKTFDFHARIRLIKLYAKVAALQGALVFTVLVTVAAIGLLALSDKDVAKFMASAQNGMEISTVAV